MTFHQVCNKKNKTKRKKKQKKKKHAHVKMYWDVIRFESAITSELAKAHTY
jgi:hypothetical protein